MFVRKVVPEARDQRQGPIWMPGMRVPRWRIGQRRIPDAAASLGRAGNLEVRLARTAGEIRRAQALRYHVFYEEKSAVPTPRTLATRRDADHYDALCEHVLVIDHDVHEPGGFSRRRRPKIVGTYRVLRQAVANQFDGFYSASEFDLQPLLDAKPDLTFLELGRSCVLKSYRTKRTLELLWHGVWSYVLMHKADVMFGCASLEGTNPNDLALPLSYMHHYCSAPSEWLVRALDERYTDMNLIPKEEINVRRAMGSLPPLIKGYLRIGACIGSGAVIDYQFDTTDVLIMMPVEKINHRYIRYYGADASRYSS